MVLGQVKPCPSWLKNPTQSINALFALKRVTPQSLLDQPLEYSPTKRSLELYDVPTSRILQRGQTFFDQIYGAVSKRVMGQMDRSGTEDLGITARLMYGYVLSNTNLLNPAESSFVLIAGLIPEDVSSTVMYFGSIRRARLIILPSQVNPQYGHPSFDTAA